MTKKLIVSLLMVLILLFTSKSWSIEWHAADQTTVSWDAVTTTEDGNTFPSGDSISYRVYIKDRINDIEIEVGNTPEVQYTISFTVEGRYLIGVRTIRVLNDRTDEIESSITWSDSLDVVAVPTPFGIEFFVKPSPPKGLAR